MDSLPPVRSARAKKGDTRTQRERALAICDQVRNGSSLRAAAKAEGLDHSEFLKMVRADEDLRVFYEAAGNDAAETNIAETDALIKNATKKVLTSRKPLSTYVRMIQTQVNFSMWHAERLNQKRYGNRLDLNHSGSIDVAGRLARAKKRIDEPPKDE